MASITARLALVLAIASSLALAGCSDDEQPRPVQAAQSNGVEAEATPVSAAQPIVEIVHEVQPSVVAVQVSGAQGAGEGSGVIWDADGIIVTNHHVVEGAQDVSVILASGERLDARVVATDPATDLAVLEVDREGLPAAEFTEGLPQVGELAVAMGNPLGFENSVTAGIVSGLDRAIPGADPSLVGLIQTDAAISPGNSGGALINAAGQVMGINVAYIPPQARAVNLGFAIPTPVVRRVVSDLLEDGEVEHPFLGVQLAPLTPQVAEQLGVEAEEGVIVAGVERGGPAAQAGIERGAVITAVGGRPVQSIEDVLAALRPRSPGDTVQVEVLRDGESATVDVTLGERP